MRFPFFALLAILAPCTAHAYIGPGLGAGALAAVLGVVAGIVMLIIGVIWYPLKKLIRRFRSKR